MPAVNQETIDSRLDEDEPVYWWQVSSCPVHGCRQFKKAKAWSMESEENVIAYLKHHLKHSTGDGHSMPKLEIAGVLTTIDVDVQEWSKENRFEWEGEQVTSRARSRSGTRRMTKQTASTGSRGSIGERGAVHVPNTEAIEVLEKLQETLKTVQHNSMINARSLTDQLETVSESLLKMREARR